MIRKYKILLFLLLALAAGAGHARQPDGPLQLLTRDFRHPTLRAWAIENAALLEPYQKGLDLMGLENQAEGPLLAAADSLSNAHGWLTFDYRIYGITASYTASDARSLIPRIQADMQAKFQVGAGMPYALLISWLDPNDQKAKLLLVLNWVGFGREGEYSSSEKSYIADLVSSAFDGNEPMVSHQLSQVVLSLKIELDPSAEGFWVVSLQNNTIRDTLSSRDTLFVCACDNEWIQMEAFKADSTAFAGKLEWAGSSSLKPSGENAARLQVNRPTVDGGIFLSVNARGDTLNNRAGLRVFILETEFSEGDGRFEFDDNKVQAYKIQYDSITGNGNRMRFKFLPSGERDQTAAKMNYGAPLEVATNIGSAALTGAARAQIHLHATNGPQINGRLHLKHHLCEKVPLKVVVAQPVKTVDVRIIIVSEEDDDVLTNPLGSAQPNMTAIEAGPDGIVQSTPGSGDSLDIQNKRILTGPDGVCNTRAKGDDIQVIPFGQGGNPAWPCAGYGQNQFRDSPLAGDDVIDQPKRVILAGPNGVCETRADSISYPFTLSPATENQVLTALDTVTFWFSRFGYALIVQKTFQNLTFPYDRNVNDTLDIAEVPYFLDNIPSKLKGDNTIVIVKNLYARPILNTVTNTPGLAYTLAGGNYEYQTTVVCGNCMTNRSTIPPNTHPLNWLIAHELGHSLLNLKHPWDDFPGVYKNAQNGEAGQDKDNLMDYQNGKKLRYYQWIKFPKPKN